MVFIMPYAPFSGLYSCSFNKQDDGFQARENNRSYSRHCYTNDINIERAYAMIRAEKLKLINFNKLISYDSPSYSGIVAGECYGDLWVDDLLNPVIALVYSYPVGSFSILGEPDNHNAYSCFIEFLENSLFKYLKNKGINHFEFSVESDKLRQFILNHFSHKAIQSEYEFSFRRNKKYEQGMMPIQEYKIHKVDDDFIEKIESDIYDNKRILTNRLLESWGSYSNFIKKSLAYVALYKNRIVSVLVGTARYNNIIPIDIETENNHKRKGLASVLTQYFVNECVENGITAQWDCVDSNIASRTLVNKAGFKFLRENVVYWFDI